MSRNSMAAAPDWSPTGPRRPAYWLCGWYDRAMAEWLRQHDVSIPPRFGPDPVEDAVKRQRGWRIGCGEEKGVANYQVTAKFDVVEEWNANPRDGTSPLFTCPSSVPTVRLRQRSRGVIYTVRGGCGRPLRLVNKSSFAAHARSGVKLLSAAHCQVPSIFPSYSPCATRPLHYRLLV